MRDNNRKSVYIFALIGILPVIWLGLVIAPHTSGGLPDMLSALTEAMEHPLNISLCEDSLKTVLIVLMIYALSIGVALASMRNYRKGEEHGSAKWGNKHTIRKKYEQKPKSNNKILTNEVCMGLNAKAHMRNLNTLVAGGSGAGKTFFFAKPNIMQCNCSFVVTDPKGEIYEDLRTTYKSFVNANAVSTIKDCFYHYRMREGSISKGKFKASRFEVLPALKSVMENEDIKKHTELIDILKNRELLLKSNLIWNIALYTSDDDYNKYKSFLKENYKELKLNRKVILRDDRFSKYMKIVSLAPNLIVPLIRKMMNVKAIKDKYSSTHEFYK